MKISRRFLWGSISLVTVVIVVLTIFLVTRQHDLGGRSLPLNGALDTFTPTDIMPDGNTLVGYGALSGSAGASIETVTLDTKHIHHLATLTNYPSMVVTDGRFIVWDTPQLTAFDQQTQRSVSITSAGSQRQQIVMLAQGQLTWETTVGDSLAINMTDLVTNTTHVVIPQTDGPVYGSWPYLLYPLVATWHLLDVAHDHDVILATSDVTPGALSGSSVFGTRVTSGDQQSGEIVMLPDAEQTDATWQHVATVTDVTNISYQANGWLVVWQMGYNHIAELQGAAPPIMQVYARATRKTTTLAGTGSAHFLVHGAWLMIVSAQHVVTIIDTAQMSL